MLTELGRRLDEHSKFNKNKKMENIRKYQTEVTGLKNTTKMKNTLEGFNNRLD